MSTLDDVRTTASDLADTANGIAHAADQRGIVLRLPTARTKWQAFVDAVRGAAGNKPPAPPTPRTPEELDYMNADPEKSLEHWEATLLELSKQAQTKGFLVTYDVWAAPAAAPGGSDAEK